MPDKISPKPFREKIKDAIAESADLILPGDSLQTVSDKMVALNTNILPVSEAGRLVGLADEPDPGLDASSHGHNPKTTRISETMNRDLVFCHEDDDCADALRKMEGRKLSHLSRIANRRPGGPRRSKRPHRDRDRGSHRGRNGDSGMRFLCLRPRLSHSHRRLGGDRGGSTGLSVMIGSMILLGIGIITGASRTRVHRPSGDSHDGSRLR
jgi:CBS domain-containing protein